jgi:hypothetical protein
VKLREVSITGCVVLTAELVPLKTAAPPWPVDQVTPPDAVAGLLPAESAAVVPAVSLRRHRPTRSAVPL